MSESNEAAAAPEAAAPAPKASKLPIILAAVNFVAVLGLAGYFVYTQQHAAAQAKKNDENAEAKEGEHGEKKADGHGEGAEEEESDEEPAAEHGAKSEGHGEKKSEGHGEKSGGHGEKAESHTEEHNAGGPLLALESMVTNLAEPDSDRYLKVSMQLRITSEAARPEVEAQMVPVRNQILLYLSSLTVSETSGADNKRDIQKKVKRIANEAMPSSRITQVYFTEFVIQ
jgi:flagellar basal body-associated protein FliL